MSPDLLPRTYSPPPTATAPVCKATMFETPRTLPFLIISLSINRVVFVADLFIIGLSATISTTSPSRALTSIDKFKVVVKLSDTLTFFTVTLL